MTSCVTAASPSGGFFAFEQFAAFGGLVTTPESYLRFMARYWGHGGVRGPGEVGDWELWGSIDGTRSYAIWRPDGTLIVAFFNRRAGVSDISYDDLGPRLKGAANATTPTP
jgi:hypothetical protein